MAVINKVGPWGNNNLPVNWSLELYPRKNIKEVIIQSGSIVDGIGFVIVDEHGVTTNTYFGGPGGDLHKITLKPWEYITYISGTYGVYGDGGQYQIASIRIHTNFLPSGYGPYGKEEGVTKVRSFSTASGSGVNVGFFGRADRFLDSIGAFIKQENPNQDNLKKSGPWGSELSTNWNLELGPRKTIRQVIIRFAYIVDGIGFVFADDSGQTTSTYFGGPGGGYQEITLKSWEYITSISGRYGEYEGGVHIASIKIHTNFSPDGYGPYGAERNVSNIRSFSTNTDNSGDPIVGFFGRVGIYLESIGIYTKPV